VSYRIGPGDKIFCVPDVSGDKMSEHAAKRRRVCNQAASWHIVRGDGGRRRDVIVIPAVLVVGPDQQRVRPALSVHDPADDLGGEALALADVLRVLFGVFVEIRRRSSCPVPERAS
jgi:hypothetical protein